MSRPLLVHEKGKAMSEKEVKRAAIASRLRVAREMAGLSQGQVAEMLGLHRPSVSEAEAGRRRISGEELARLAEIYDVSASWLIGIGGEEPSPDSDRVQLAARELAKLKSDDLERVMQLLRALRKSGGKIG